MKNSKFLLCLFSMLFFFAQIFSQKIYIIPPGGYEDGKLFDLQQEWLNRDNCIKHFYQLKNALSQLGYELVTARVSDNMSDGYAIFTSGINKEMVNLFEQYKDKKIIAFIWEPPTTELESYNKSLHEIFSKVFIMDDEWVDQIKYKKLFYPHPDLEIVEKLIPFKEKKLCTLIAGNKSSSYSQELYSERRKAIQFFSNYPKEFEFYGKGWNSSDWCCYKGDVKKKVDVLKNYKFSICFENTSNMNGYISEKIFDSFQAGCIPIYYGAPNITHYIPSSCFIDFRNFKSYDDLYSFLKNMSKQRYTLYLKSIKEFLKTKRAFCFSFDYFVNEVLEELFPGYDKSIIFDKETIKSLEEIKEC